MTVKLSDLLAEKTKGEIQVGGSIVGFVFHTFWRDRFNDEERASHLTMPFREYAKMWLPRVLISWDLQDGDGHGVPVTAEAIDQHNLPDPLLLAFHSYVINSDLSGKVTSSNSPGT
jgi:hypothetical protein